MNRIASSSGVWAFAALLTLSLSACQAGSSTDSAQEYNPTDGRSANVPADAGWGDPYVAVRGAKVAASDTLGSVIVTVVNKTGAPETLDAVTIAGIPAELSGAVEIPDGGIVTLGAGGQATAVVDGFEAVPGQWVDLTLDFGQSGSADMRVLTVAPQAIPLAAP